MRGSQSCSQHSLAGSPPFAGFLLFSILLPLFLSDVFWEQLAHKLLALTCLRIWGIRCVLMVAFPAGETLSVGSPGDQRSLPSSPPALLLLFTHLRLCLSEK